MTLGSSDNIIIPMVGSKLSDKLREFCCGISESGDSSMCSSCIVENITSLLIRRLLFAENNFPLFGLSKDSTLLSDALLPDWKEVLLSADDKTLVTEVRLPGKDENEERALFMMAESCWGNCVFSEYDLQHIL